MLAFIDFEEYFDPLYGSSIVLPPNCVFYRGYDTQYPTISEWPSHYSGVHVAASYAVGQKKTLGMFTNTKPLRILDFRYMKVLLQNMFQSRPDNDESTLDPIIRTSVAYGMCDIVDQIRLGTNMFIHSPGMTALKEYYTSFIEGKSYIQKPLDINPVSTSGFRIAETNNDAYILAFLKKCMGHMVDGFVAPRLKSPYHVEKHGTMSPELILFSPSKVGIIQIGNHNIPTSQPHISFNTILNMQTRPVDITYNNIKSTHRVRAKGINCSGGGGTPSPCDASMHASDEVFQNAYVHKNKAAVNLLKSASKAATKWKKQFSFIDHYAKHPDCLNGDWKDGL